MAVAVEIKDGYTADHCDRIQALSSRTGARLGLSPARQHYLLYGAFLHDLGKVRVPDTILLKPDRLTPDEWAVMRQHPTFGREMLQRTFLAGAGFIVEQHHERLDGSGYPLGLKRDEISLEAQIVAVVDSYDAMTSDRVYRKALTISTGCCGVKSRRRSDLSHRRGGGFPGNALGITVGIRRKETVHTKWNRLVGVTVLAILLLTGTAFADYQSDQDLTVSVELLPGTLQTSSYTGSTTFALQEGLHQTFTSTTGGSLDHSYLWVNVNGQPILAVDPLCLYSGR